MTLRSVRRALVSVSDKHDLVAFAQRLVAAGVEIVSSGGTAATLESAGVAVTKVAEVTGSPEILGGRVKTLHPRIHGGILAIPDAPDHAADLASNGIQPFELVVVNLYPFEATIAQEDVTPAEAIEQIDIGGPTLIRAAAKNHQYVGVVTSPDQYAAVAEAVEAGGLDDELRIELARAAFARTARYDAAILGWLDRSDELPSDLVLPLRRSATLRYGENPDQAAAVYQEGAADSWWTVAEQLQGKDMSFNNYADTEAAWRLVNEFAEPAAVIVKHTNACGAAIGDDIPEAFRSAWECDPLSAFGGIVAINRSLDVATAIQIADYFVEVVIASAIDNGALDALSGRPSLRVLAAPRPGSRGVEARPIDGGFLVQVRDTIEADATHWTVASARKPTADEVAALEFAWVVAAHTKSNAIVVAADRAAVGVGAGDQSRVGAAERALAKAGKRSDGAVAASDAFLPFRDTVDVLAHAGVTALVEPGGSKGDDEVVAAANERGMALLFTGRRHFKH